MEQQVQISRLYGSDPLHTALNDAYNELEPGRPAFFHVEFSNGVAKVTFMPTVAKTPSERFDSQSGWQSTPHLYHKKTYGDNVFVLARDTGTLLTLTAHYLEPLI